MEYREDYLFNVILKKGLDCDDCLWVEVFECPGHLNQGCPTYKNELEELGYEIVLKKNN
jgi:hypothetical protein